MYRRLCFAGFRSYGRPSSSASFGALRSGRHRRQIVVRHEIELQLLHSQHLCKFALEAVVNDSEYGQFDDGLGLVEAGEIVHEEACPLRVVHCFALERAGLLKVDSSL